MKDNNQPEESAADKPVDANKSFKQIPVVIDADEPKDDVKAAEPVSAVETSDKKAAAIEGKTEPQAEAVTNESPKAPNDVQPKSHKVLDKIKLPHFSKKTYLITGIITVLLLNGGMAFGNYYFAHQVANKPATTVTPAAAKKVTAGVKPVAAAAKPADAPTILHYTSTAMNVEFDYPVDWRIEASSDNTSITMTSAPFKIETVEGKTDTGTINLTIASKDSATTGFVSDSSTVAASSTSLAYTSPSTVQRKVTNLTYVNSNGQINTNIDTVLVTGGYAYRQGQALGAHNYKSVDPQISLYVADCPETRCFYFATASFNLNTWQTNAELVKAKDVIASMRFTK